MQHTTETKRKFSWPLGLLMSTIMLGCILLFFDLRYDTIDDTVILRQMMGFGVQEIPDFNMYVSFVLFAVLRWLSLLLPGFPWFSYMQLFLLWFAAAVIGKSIIQCFENQNRPAWQGLILAAFFHFVFILRCQSHITYTVTAGLLGAAAVAQLMSIDSPHCSCGQWIRSALLSLLLILFSYCLRQQAMLPSLLFCLLAFAVQGIRRQAAGQNWLRPLLSTFLIVTMSLGLVMGLRAWEIHSKPGVREYVDWQEARIQIWDYLGIGNVPAETLEEYEISEARKALLHEWYQMDGDLDTETLLALGEAIKAGRNNTFSAQINRMRSCIAGLLRSEPVTVRSLWVLAGLILCTAAFLCVNHKAGKTALWTGLLSGIIIAIALPLYLAYQGRLNLRGFLTILLPFAALMVCCLPQSLPPDRLAANKAIGGLACIVLLITSTLYAIPFLQSHLRRPPTEKELATETVLAAMDEYAAANEDYLLIYDGTLAIDMRMFPSTENGIPKNLHLWGGWNLHSPAYNAMLEAYGFDPDNWSVEDFLSYDVRFLRRNAAAPSLLLDVLNESTQAECYLDTEWDGVYAMFFEEQ